MINGSTAKQATQKMKVSVIVPTLNESEHILPCIRSVKEQAPEVEIIVVDGGSTDGTRDLATPWAFVLSAERGRAVQLNAGARQASGEVLLLLHADCTLDPGALTAVREILNDGRILGGTFTLAFDTNLLRLRLIAFFTRFNFRILHYYGDQGIFVRRSAFEALGGFKDLPLMDDVDFLRRLNRTGAVGLINLPVTTSARRFLARGILRQQLLNTLLVALYLLGFKAETLARWYK